MKKLTSALALVALVIVIIAAVSTANTDTSAVDESGHRQAPFPPVAGSRGQTSMLISLRLPQLLNFTLPGLSANKVKSRPIPTLLPG